MEEWIAWNIYLDIKYKACINRFPDMRYRFYYIIESVYHKLKFVVMRAIVLGADEDELAPNQMNCHPRWLGVSSIPYWQEGCEWTN